MQTVQESLWNVDEDQLIAAYLAAHPLNLGGVDPDQTIGEVQAEIHTGLHAYLKRLKELPIKEPASGSNGIFYVYHCLGTELGIDFGLTFFDDLRSRGINAHNYDYVLAEQAEILGYLIADTDLTQYYLPELLVNIMYEASFFGFKQEYLAQAKAQLDETAEKAENAAADDGLDELLAKLDSKADYLSDEEQQLQRHAWGAVSAFNEHAKSVELAKVIASLYQ